MKKKLKIVLSSLVVLIIGVVFMLDLQYRFGNYDIPFGIVIVCYLVLWGLTTLSVRYLLIILVPMLLSLAGSYILLGPVRLTERLGEWMIILFTLAVFHYAFHVFRIKDLDL